METLTFKTVGELVRWSKKFPDRWLDEMTISCAGRQGIQCRFNFIPVPDGKNTFLLEVFSPASALVKEASNFAFLKKQAE